MDSEFIAAARGVQEVLGCHELLQEIGYTIAQPIPLFKAEQGTNGQTHLPVEQYAFCTLVKDQDFNQHNRSLIVLKNHNFRLQINLQVRQHSLQPNNFLYICNEAYILRFSKRRSNSWSPL
jgi:hypothetical protein